MHVLKNKPDQLNINMYTNQAFHIQNLTILTTVYIHLIIYIFMSYSYEYFYFFRIFLL